MASLNHRSPYPQRKAKKMNAVIYTRVSSDMQVDGTSLATQGDICSRYASDHEMQVVGTFTDAGKSAKSTKGRDALAQALIMCKDEKAALIVYRFDRLARNVADAAAIRDILVAKGCSIISATEGEATDSPVSKLIYAIMSALAEWENGIRSERVMLGKRARAKMGGWIGGQPPIGFALGGKDSNHSSMLQPDGERADIIAKALTDFAYGRVARAEVQKRLMHRLGIMRRRTNYIFRSTIYGGVIKGRCTGGEEIKACFDGIVSIKVWRLANKRYYSTKKIILKDNPAFPLRGKIKCAMCGKFLTAGFSDPARYGHRFGYYFCTTKGHSYIRREDAHKEVGIIVE